jgi:beta-glucosidase
LLLTSVVFAADPLYKNPQAPIEARINDLLSRMTLEEKVAQLGGDQTAMSTPRNDRLGIPQLLMSDGPLAVRWDKSTVFPGGLAMAASWDVDLVTRIGAALGREFRGKGRYIALGPCINLMRDPRGGRSFEGMGEDPYLIGRLATAYVLGMQSEKCVSVVKHYACNNQEDGRGENDVHVDERTLREVYLPHFRAVVRDGHALGIMAAYNKVNGEHCAENTHLLRDILKDDWGFEGFVVSDWGACHSTVESINGGLDCEMPTASFYDNRLVAAVKAGKVKEATIDDSVRRILRLKFWSGEFDRPVKPNEKAVNTKQHQQLALEAAREAIVLLKNDGNLLPLNRASVHSIAVIGPNAAVARPDGGGSAQGTPYYATDPLTSIRNHAAPGTEIVYAQGCPMPNEGTLSPIPSSALAPPDAAPDVHGLRGEYFANQNVQGQPVLTRVDPIVGFDWGTGSPDAKVPSEHFSARWTGTFTPPTSGDYLIGTGTDDGGRLWIDDKLVIDDWRDHGYEEHRARMALQAGRSYKIRMEYYQNTGLALAKLVWQEPGKPVDTFAEARDAARKCDVAVVVVGTSPGIESEGHDRDTLALPEGQDALIKAVAEANPKTIVAMVTGSVCLVSPWINNVSAAVQAWFDGQEGGTALADVLFGDYNPGGKLAVTLPRSDEQLPPFNNSYETVAEGRGYRYYDAQKINPEFPFGYGLSYTTFRYGAATVSPQTASTSTPITVKVDVTNAGKRAGAEIVQLYVHASGVAAPRPPQELKAFARLYLQPGEKKTATLTIKPEDLGYWDVTARRFITETGAYEVRVGSSSRHIRARGTFTLQ